MDHLSGRPTAASLRLEVADGRLRRTSSAWTSYPPHEFVLRNDGSAPVRVTSARVTTSTVLGLSDFPITVGAGEDLRLPVTCKLFPDATRKTGRVWLTLDNGETVELRLVAQRVD